MNRIFSTLLQISANVLLLSQIATAQSAIISTKRESPAGIVVFESAVQSDILGAGNFVDGYIRRNGSDPFVFPVGDNGALRPFVTSANGVSGAYYRADPGVAITSDPQGGDYGPLPAGAPFGRGSLATGLNGISAVEYWDINGAEQTRITLTWNADSRIGELTSGRGLSKLTIAGWDGGKWVRIASDVDATSILGGNSTEQAGSITTTAAVVPDDYNVYALASIPDGSLPVTLVTFAATARETSASLDWVTSEEINSSRFDIERSGDGKRWSKLGTKAANGDAGVSEAMPMKYNFIDENPLQGVNLYRLKMVDRDETFTYSTIKTLNFELVSGEILAFPNPAVDKVFLKGIENQKVQHVSLIDQTGRVVMSPKSLSKEGLDVSGLSQGLYLLNVSFSDGTGKALKVLVKK